MNCTDTPFPVWKIFPLPKASKLFQYFLLVIRSTTLPIFCSCWKHHNCLQLLLHQVFVAASYVSPSSAMWHGFPSRWGLSLAQRRCPLPQYGICVGKYIWIQRVKRLLLQQALEITKMSRSSPGRGPSLTSSGHQNRIAFCLCPLVSSKNNCGHVSTCEPLPCAISRLDRTLRGWHQLCKKKETPILCASRNLNQANWYLRFICSIKKPRNTKHFLLNIEMTFSFQVSAKIQVYPKNK